MTAPAEDVCPKRLTTQADAMDLALREFVAWVRDYEAASGEALLNGGYWDSRLGVIAERAAEVLRMEVGK